MKDWRKALIKPHASIIDAMRAIDDAAMQLGLVVNDKEELLGTVTDGDIRRALLSGKRLEDAVADVMRTDPSTGSLADRKEDLMALLQAKSIRHIPMLDDQGVLVGVETMESLLAAQRLPNPVLLLAGGLGSRLGDLTKNLPKPMLNVGRKPILETIMGSFRDKGFHHFYFSVNYKANMIESYFGTGERFDVKIDYLKEDRPLGTAGALGLMPTPEHDVMVMNGDLLTNMDFTQLLAFHKQQGAAATMCVRAFDFQIPYGVIEAKDHILTQIKEKPSEQFNINAGIYVISPRAFGAVPKGERFDMTSLFEDLQSRGEKVVVYPVQDYWLDIGQLDDFERATQDASWLLGEE